MGYEKLGDEERGQNNTLEKRIKVSTGVYGTN